MFKRVFLALFLLSGTFAARVPGAHAQGALTLDRILPEIRRSVPGNFGGDAEGPDAQGRYRIKWVTPDGRVIWLEADARTGRILGQTNGGTERQPNPPPGRRNLFGN